MMINESVTPDEAGQRLDVWCVAHFPSYSRAVIQRAIKEGNIKVGDQVVKPRYVVREGNSVSGEIKGALAVTVAPVAAVSPSIPILYEDRDAVVINKPVGLVVHPGVAQETSTVASWLADHLKSAEIIGEDPIRSGIVHRLDKDTSGVLILAKHQRAYDHLKSQFQRRRAHKEYLALVFGQPGEPKGRINRALQRSKRNPLRRTIDPAGKEAVTEWRLEEKLGQRFALLRLYPLTGRMHQLRVHLHFLGFPIVGDQLYTFKRQRPPQSAKRQLLHAEKLTLTMPNDKRMTFTAPLPADFETVLNELKAAA